MSRNLTTSSCCGNVVRLSDVLGKPLEARRYFKYAPDFGTRWDCPSCGTAYFVIIHRRDQFWSDPIRAFDDDLGYDGQGNAIPNRERGRFVFATESNPFGKGEVRYEQTGCFTLDLSYYESYNDEHDFDCKIGEVDGQAGMCVTHGVPYHDKHERGIVGIDSPRHLVTDDCQDVQWVW